MPVSNCTHKFNVNLTRIACEIDTRPVKGYQLGMVPDPIYKHIGAIIQTRRKKLGLKQETLAGKLSISRGSLANIETGKQSILVHQLYKFAVALELSPLDFLPVVADTNRVDRTDLPLPDDLKGSQKEQVALFFEQINTTQSRNREEYNVKSTKR